MCRAIDAHPIGRSVVDRGCSRSGARDTSMRRVRFARQILSRVGSNEMAKWLQIGIYSGLGFCILHFVLTIYANWPHGKPEKPFPTATGQCVCHVVEMCGETHVLSISTGQPSVGAPRIEPRLGRGARKPTCNLINVLAENLTAALGCLMIVAMLVAVVRK